MPNTYNNHKNFTNIQSITILRTHKPYITNSSISPSILSTDSNICTFYKNLYCFDQVNCFFMSNSNAVYHCIQFMSMDTWYLIAIVMERHNIPTSHGQNVSEKYMNHKKNPTDLIIIILLNLQGLMHLQDLKEFRNNRNFHFLL